MDEVKIENFRRAHPQGEFPGYETLAPETAAIIRRAIASSLNLHSDTEPMDVVRTLHEQPGEDMGSVPDSHDFDIRGLLSEAGVAAGDQVYLNWYRFDEVDQIALDSFSKHFDDIWYPSSDDLDVFDDTLTWFLSISHSGKTVLRRLAAGKMT